jgi:iron complex outermembrane receptor protein
MTFTPKNIRALRRGAALGGIVAALLTGSQAFADANAAASASPAADSSQLGDIVVTAQHRTENLRQVPIAINVVSADALKNAGIGDTSALVEAVPSLNFTRSGPSGIFVIRGVSTPNGAAGEEGSTAVYVDDVYMPDLASTINNFNNIKSVEVLNGPQGTLFGRNATGGVIRVMTKDPSTDHVVFDGQAGYGNYQTITGQAYVSSPINDTTAIDLAFTGQNQGKGFGYDSTLHSDVRTDDHWGVRSKLVAHPAANLKVTLAGDYYQTDDTTSVYVFPVVIAPATLVATGPTASQDSPAGFPSSISIRAWGVHATEELALGFANLTSITSYRKLDNHAFFDIDGAAADVFHLFYTSGSRTFQQELRLASKTTEPLSWQVGAFYLHGTAINDQGQRGLAFALNPPAKGGPLLGQNIYGKATTDSISAFGEATYALTPSTHLTGGIRYTSDQRKLDPASNVTTLRADSSVLVVVTQAHPSATFNQVTFRAALRQDLTDNIDVYASVNKGFKAGEFNLQAPGDAPVKPETIMAYEGGLKGDFLDRHLRLSLAGYHYDIKNYQIRTTIGTVTALQNATSVKIDGADINAEALLTSQLHLNVGASWLNARFGQFGGPGTNTTAPGYYPASDPGNATGHQTPLAPHFTLNVGGTYTVPLGDARELRLTAAMTHKSSYAFEADNVLRQPGYNSVNASAEFKLNEHFSIEGWIHNIGNVNYNVEMTTAVGQTALAAPPRTYGVNVKANF